LGGEIGIKALIGGRVQGVGFRFFTQAKASAYGLKGYVRNLSDGRVEVVAAGSRTVLEAFLSDVKQGPPASTVRECQVEWMPNPGRFTGFSIRL